MVESLGYYLLSSLYAILMLHNHFLEAQSVQPPRSPKPRANEEMQFSQGLTSQDSGIKSSAIHRLLVCCLTPHPFLHGSEGVLAFSYGYRGSLSRLFVDCRSVSLVARGLKDEQTIEDG